MKDNKIIAAYDRIAPDAACRQRMLYRILAEAGPIKTARTGNRLRWVLLAAACVAALAALAGIGYAAARTWRLPAPEVYEAPRNGGIYEVHETAVYSDPAILETDFQPAQTDGAGQTTAPAQPSEPAALTDEDFIRQGLALLRQVGVMDAAPEKLTVVRQENLYWGREEAEILFDQGEIRTSVKFDAETGKFLGLSGIDWQLEGSAACATHAEADELARQYYEALPVEQGYVLTHCSEYDAQFWSYEFCREVEPGIFNPYEMIRISINPVSGRLTNCVVFCVPLLDDHEPGQERITQAEAEQIARSSLPELLDGRELLAAETVIGIPNWNYTQYQTGPNHRASDVSRWAWSLTFECPNSEYTDQIRILVDCYTGEILGGDAAK